MSRNLFQQRRIWAIGATLGIAILLLILLGWILHSSRPQRSSVAMKCASIDFLDEQAAPFSMGASTSQTQAPSVDLLPRKLIRNARLTLKIQRYETFDSSLHMLAQRFGYVSNVQVNQDVHGVRRAEITLRVESGRFEEALTAFKKLGSVKHEEVSVEDVSRSYADLEARYSNKRTSAARLREIIQTRTGKLSDVIEAEGALAKITEEMEVLEAQKRGLDSQLSYSTIQAQVFEPVVVEQAKAASLWAPVGESLKEARGALIGSLAFMLSAALVLSPWALIVLGIVWGVRRYILRKKVDPAIP